MAAAGNDESGKVAYPWCQALLLQKHNVPDGGSHDAKDAEGEAVAEAVGQVGGR